jgi:tyrosine-protein phosphatase YwqE
MVDLHSHLLDNLEKSPKEIVRSLKFAQKRGYHKVVFTPRVSGLDLKCSTYEGIVEHFNKVKEQLEEDQVTIEVSLGCEINAYKGIEEDLQKCVSEDPSLNYVVLDVASYRSSIDELAYTLSLHGITPIFTGIEKTGYKHLSLHAKKWRDSGAGILITAKNMFGNTIEANRVRQLIRSGQIDYVSSGHNKRFNPFIILRIARLYVSGVVGPRYAKQIFSLNARALFDIEETLIIE